MRHTVFSMTLAFLFFASPSFADNHGHDHTKEAGVEVSHQKLSDHVYILQGQGGNVGLFVGETDVFVIDNDHGHVSPSIVSKIKEITPNPIRFLANTHWHGDHTGGNKIIGESGAVIVAHDNVRKRLSEENYIEAFDMRSEPQPHVALPEITYGERVSLRLDKGDAHLIHIPNAHTDGDTVVHFVDENIIHAGDIYFNGFYPFIDAATGGTMEGMIRGAKLIIDMSNDDTVIIPGHGPVSNKKELQAYHDMLVGVHNALKPMVDAGKTLDEVKAADPLKPFNEKWGNGFLKPDKWIGIAYEAVK
ncbi:MAG: MBL fold metallo-hydrolase [Alphaproteobacteria bacterium]|nr:MBL fold metallo-hydrolase [Alphaproteobacteria bacterium]